MLAVGLLPSAYVLDCLDGQLARYTERTSPLGDYLDKTLDVIKIGAINAAIGAAAYQATGRVLYLVLAFASCFGFLFRYYIKLETMFGAIQRDATYLERSRARRRELYDELDLRRAARKTISERLRWWWLRNRSLLALDEAEHVTLGAIAIAFDRPDLWCWLFGIGQLAIALVRLVDRGQRVVSRPQSLIDPLRK